MIQPRSDQFQCLEFSFVFQSFLWGWVLGKALFPLAGHLCQLALIWTQIRVTNNKLAFNSTSGKNTTIACRQRGKELTPGREGGKV